MFCPNCGNPLNNDAAFCPSCGHQVQKESSSGQVNQSAEGQVYVKDPKMCPNCNKIYEKPKFKLKPKNIVLIVLGVIGLFVFAPVGIILIVLGCVLGRKDLPCPYCGCTESQYKKNMQIKKVKQSKSYKPESYTQFYRNLSNINAKYKLLRVIHIFLIPFSLLTFLPFLMKVTLKFFALGVLVKEQTSVYFDIIGNANEAIVMVMTVLWFVTLFISIISNAMRRNLWLKLSLIAVCGVNIILNLFMTEKYITGELLYALVRDEFARKMIDASTASLGAPKTLLIIMQIVIITLTVASCLIARAELLKEAFEPSAEEE